MGGVGYVADAVACGMLEMGWMGYSLWACNNTWWSSVGSMEAAGHCLLGI